MVINSYIQIGTVLLVQKHM